MFRSLYSDLSWIMEWSWYTNDILDLTILNLRKVRKVKQISHFNLFFVENKSWWLDPNSPTLGFLVILKATEFRQRVNFVKLILPVILENFPAPKRCPYRSLLKAPPEKEEQVREWYSPVYCNRILGSDIVKILNIYTMLSCTNL